MIDQLKQQDSAGFKDPAGEAQIRLGRGGVTRGMIVLCGANSYVQCADELPVRGEFYRGSLTPLLHISRCAFLRASGPLDADS